jgi:hypothetical protein
MTNRDLRLRAALYALITAASAYRVWLVVRFNPAGQVWSDMARHWQAGLRPLDASPMALIDPVGYQLYLVVIAKLTLGSSTLIAYWTALLSVVGPWLWYRFLRELLPERSWALAGWALLAALPSWSGIYSYFMQETLMLPLLGAALWATWRARRKGDRASFAVAIALWLAAGLTRGICLPLGAVAMGMLWFQQDGKWAKLALGTGLLAAVFVPLAGRSWSGAHLVSPHGIGRLAHLYLVAGTRSMAIDFTRNGGRERWHYEFVSPSMNHAPLAPWSDWPRPREGETRVSIDLDKGAEDWQVARDGLPSWKGERALRLTAENLVHLFVGPSWPDTDIEGKLRRGVGQWNYWMRWLWAPLAVACLMVLLMRWRRQRDWLLPALLGTWIVVQGVLPLSLNEGRYRKPFEGLLIAQCLALVAGTRARHRGPRDGREGEPRQDRLLPGTGQE